jgi:hypothetical protein
VLFCTEYQRKVHPIAHVTLALWPSDSVISTSPSPVKFARASYSQTSRESIGASCPACSDHRPDCQIYTFPKCRTTASNEHPLLTAHERFTRFSTNQMPLLECKRVITTAKQIVVSCVESLVLAVVLTSVAFCQATKTDLGIHCVSLPGDVVGGQLCGAVREAVAKSSRYQEAVGNPQGWQLRLATMGIDDGKGTAVSMTLLYHMIYVVNTVQVCGGSVIPDCALGMLSDSDDHIRLLDKAVKAR